MIGIKVVEKISSLTNKKLVVLNDTRHNVTRLQAVELYYKVKITLERRRVPLARKTVLVVKTEESFRQQTALQLHCVPKY